MCIRDRLYREYSGIFFKSQKLINQLKRLEAK
ncbi:hypothetical protein, partial [Staphylococcus carnosus]